MIASNRSGKRPGTPSSQRFTPTRPGHSKGFQGAQSTGVGLAHTEENLPAHTPDAAGGRPRRSRPLDQLQSCHEEVATPQATLPGDRRLLPQAGGGCPTTAWAMRLRPAGFPPRGEGVLDKYRDYYQFHQQRVAELKQQEANFTEAQKGLWTLF